MLNKKFFKNNRQNHLLDPDEVLADSISALGSVYASEGKIERPISRVSYSIFLLLVVLGFFYLTMRAGFLQVKAGENFFAKSQENRFIVRPLFAPRGVLYDRFQQPLVENIPSFGVVFEKEEFLENGGDLGDLLVRLAEILNHPPDYFYEQGFPKDHDPRRLPRRILVTQDISPEKIVSIASRLNSLPGIQTLESFRRVYKNPLALSHLLGFVGKVSENDLVFDPKLQSHDFIGKSGVELQYDEKIRGKSGKKIVEMNADGVETRLRLVEEANAGSNVLLTIDGGLQEKIYEIIQHYTSGTKGASAVALDPRDGAVRALVSFPGFDSNSFGYSLSAKEFNHVLQDPVKPLFNRALSGEFPSGSTIKPLVAAAALQENIIDPQKKIYDEGFIEIPNPYKPGEKSVFVDWKKHGWVNLYDAIAMSANVYFYTIGGGYKDQPGLGIERLKKYAYAFGLGAKTGIDLPGEKAGIFPDPVWKENTDKENPVWRIGDTYNTSIGQGGVKVTPLQMAVLTSAIANGGKLYEPRVLNRFIEKGDESRSSETNKISPKVIREGMVDPTVLEEVKKGMRQTVTSGTARLLENLPVAVSAKTGTAQAGSGIPHAWVTIFAPSQDPEIVIVVMIEHAGEGSTVAVPITHDILQWYFSQTR